MPIRRQEKRPAALAGWREILLDFLFPPRCVGCGARGAWLCSACRSALPRLPGDRCPFCGRRPFLLSSAAGQGPGGLGQSPCASCRAAHPSLDGLYSAYAFEGTLRKAVHQLKYRRARHLARPLGDLLLESLCFPQDTQEVQSSTLAGSVDVVVPVPLHPSRRRERGYNQSELLAAELARATSLPLATDSLRKIRPTEPQMRLPAAARRANVAGAFAVFGSTLAGRRVLLVDDVCTTGSTLEACAAALKAAGCPAVRAVTLARAL